MRTFPKLILILLSGLLPVPVLFAQVSSEEADLIKPISYKTYTGNDNVFVFYSGPGKEVKGYLRVDYPDPGNFTFRWSAFDTLINDWGPGFKTDSNVPFSEALDLEEGGYRIEVSDGLDVDTVFYGWVFIDNFLVDVLEDENGELKLGKYTCDFITLNGYVYPDSFFYYDPISFEKIRVVNGYTFLWTSDNPDHIIPNADKKLNTNTTGRPPVKDTWFILTATDSFGMQDVDSVYYETINVESEFNFEFFDFEESNDYIEPPSDQKSGAPLKVRFTNKSSNGYNFEWIFQDSVENDLPDSEFTENVDYQPEYTYFIPDSYFPKLVAISEEGCIDTFKIEEPIKVEESDLKAPNVFSPEGLEQNRYFKVSFKSIKEFHIRIYSRTGNLVYKADVTDMYSWDGWDGNIMNSNRPAPPGAYFYVIEATGYDEVRYNKGPYKGVVYLFRGKN